MAVIAERREMRRRPSRRLYSPTVAYSELRELGLRAGSAIRDA